MGKLAMIEGTVKIGKIYIKANSGLTWLSFNI